MTPLRPLQPVCVACGAPGVYREDYGYVLCDTHAEVPSYAPPPVEKTDAEDDE